MRLVFRLPEKIDPSLINIGDEISVEHKSDNGLTTTVRGIVGKQASFHSVKHLMTDQGATILTWTPGKDHGLKVMRHSKLEMVQNTLFDAMDEVRKRIAS